MVTRAKPGIDFSSFPESDGEPMAETLPNVIQMVDLQWTLQTLFDLQGRAGMTTVGGNQFVYYNPANGRDNISPDVYVAFDRPPPGPSKWQTWVEGAFPAIVFEITSPSTQGQDLSDARGGKRRLYAELGAREYYIYDPQQDMKPPFQGFESRDGRMERLPALPGGGIVSPLLGTELRPVAMGQTRRRLAGTWLRVIDPRTGQPIQIAEEEHHAYQMAREQLAEEEQARLAVEERLSEEEQARLAAEQRAVAEQTVRLKADQARVAAEGRAAQAEAALQALLAEWAR